MPLSYVLGIMYIYAEIMKVSTSTSVRMSMNLICVCFLLVIGVKQLRGRKIAGWFEKEEEGKWEGRELDWSRVGLKNRAILLGRNEGYLGSPRQINAMDLLWNRTEGQEKNEWSPINSQSWMNNRTYLNDEKRTHIIWMCAVSRGVRNVKK